MKRKIPAFEDTKPYSDDTRKIPAFEDTLPYSKDTENNQSPEVSLVNKPSKIQSAIRGLAQGLSSGFADEVTAAGESLVTPKTYDQALQESRLAYKQAQEENPIISAAGEVAGGVGQLAIPGVGLLGKTPTMVQALLKGAALGGLSGAGKSEGQTVKDVAKDTAVGAGIGGAVGGAFKGLGVSLDKIKNSENAPEYIKELFRSFDIGKKGQGLISQKSKKEIEEKVANASGNVVNYFDENLSKLGELRNHIFENAPDSVQAAKPLDRALKSLRGIPGAQSSIEQIKAIIKKSQYPKATPLQYKAGGEYSLEDLAANELKGEVQDIPASAVHDIVQILQQFTPNKNKNGTMEVLNSLGKLKAAYTDSIPEKRVKQILENAPEDLKDVYQSLVENSATKNLSPLQAINKKFTNVMSAESILGLDGPGSFVADKFNKTEKAGNLIRNLQRGTDGGEKSREAMKVASGLIKEVDKSFSGNLDSVTQEAAELHKLSNMGANSGGTDKAQLLSSFKSLGVVPANLAGQLSAQPQRIIDAATRKFGANSTLTKTAEKLLDNPSEAGKRAAINTLMQISAFRNLLKEEGFNGEEN